MAFAMPHNCFAFDFAIPICMKKKSHKGGPIYSYISVQVKAAQDTSHSQLEDMNMHLHYVRCPLKASPDHYASSCPNCEEFEAVQEMYTYQIAISMAIDGKGEKFERPNIFNYSGQNRSVNDLLSRIYHGPDEVFTCGKPQLNEPVINGQFQLEYRNQLPKANFPKLKFHHSVRITNTLDVNVLHWNLTEGV